MLNTTHNDAATDTDIKPDKESLCATPHEANDFMSLQEIVKDTMKGSKIQLLRVDRLLLRDDLLGAISSTLK